MEDTLRNSISRMGFKKRYSLSGSHFDFMPSVNFNNQIFRIGEGVAVSFSSESGGPKELIGVIRAFGGNTNFYATWLKHDNPSALSVTSIEITLQTKGYVDTKPLPLSCISRYIRIEFCEFRFLEKLLLIQEECGRIDEGSSSSSSGSSDDFSAAATLLEVGKR
jgi:hypothetical protein